MVVVPGLFLVCGGPGAIPPHTAYPSLPAGLSCMHCCSSDVFAVFSSELHSAVLGANVPTQYKNPQELKEVFHGGFQSRVQFPVIYELLTLPAL